MKKIVTLLATCTLIILLAGCGNKITSKNNDIYKVDVTKVTSDDGDWIIEGTTKAPDGSRIIATSPSDMATGENTATTEDDSSVKVEDGKFTTYIDPIDVMDTDNAKKGKKAKRHALYRRHPQESRIQHGQEKSGDPCQPDHSSHQQIGDDDYDIHRHFLKPSFPVPGSGTLPGKFFAHPSSGSHNLS